MALFDDVFKGGNLLTGVAVAIGAAVLAGFAVMRFLKTSTANPVSHSSVGHQGHAGQGYGTGSQPMGVHVSPSSSANWPSRGTGMSG